MRKLIVLIGAPGTGKSTFTNYLNQITSTNLKENQLCVLSLDSFRQLMCPVATDTEGESVFLAGRNRQLYYAAYEAAVEAHLIAGETVVIDNTNTRIRDFKQTIELAQGLGYKVAIVKFDIPLNVIIQRDKNRHNTSYVGEDIIRTLYERIHTMQSSQMPQIDCMFTVNEENMVNIAHKVYQDFLCQDTNITNPQAKRVCIIGDIHSSADRLQKLYDQICESNLLTQVIFTGDLFDRGDNPLGVLDIIKQMQENPNIVNMTFIEGNHDEHLRRLIYRPQEKTQRHNNHLSCQSTLDKLDEYTGDKNLTKQNRNALKVAYGDTTAKFGYTEHTLNIIKQHINPWYLTCCKQLLKEMIPLATLHINNTIYVITHGGIAPIIAKQVANTDIMPVGLSANDCIYGACDRDTVYNRPHPSDYNFATINACHGGTISDNITFAQVFGHRNTNPNISNLPDIDPKQNRYSLESKAETPEGCLTAMVIDTTDGTHLIHTY